MGIAEAIFVFTNFFAIKKIKFSPYCRRGANYEASLLVFTPRGVMPLEVNFF
jgi:hypothetical protein